MLEKDVTIVNSDDMNDCVVVKVPLKEWCYYALNECDDDDVFETAFDELGGVIARVILESPPDSELHSFNKKNWEIGHIYD